jgi:valyl-tRNA synthetase
MDKRYKPQEMEAQIRELWDRVGVHRFQEASSAPVFSIDTPPPTVSGHLHLGHVFSYSHTDFMARFWRMQGRNVYYPMGFDDNGLPTERLVERRQGITVESVGREEFIRRCLETSQQEAAAYEALWRRLGLSIDWRFTYRTIGEDARRISQWSFLDLYRKGYIYRQEAPVIWCPTCQTAIAQAELDDLERPSELHLIRFWLEGGDPLRIATTRPELLPACVAVFVHPDDERANELAGKDARTPVFHQPVPILTDELADPEKGTGVVMCCTFGDTVDVDWWRRYDLPQRIVLQKDGRMGPAAGELKGLEIEAARQRVLERLRKEDAYEGSQDIIQSVRVHERCDTPVEYLTSMQWFVRVLENKEALKARGEQLNWFPANMKNRYLEWVENLHWDWCISRQRAYGVAFPVWTCAKCGQVLLADEAMLPMDPMTSHPEDACGCGAHDWVGETDVMDTWATSSLSPQIAGRMFTEVDLYQRLTPFSLRPQAHEIIRTWAFYTIAKSHYHFDQLPWKDVAISGWGLAPEGGEKISKSRGGGPIGPSEVMDRYSADAVRYWASATSLGKDSVISEPKIQAGAKFITKLWNVARFAQRFLETGCPLQKDAAFTPIDRWMLSKTQALIDHATDCYLKYDYAGARQTAEVFLWTDLADNYIELVKQRLYAGDKQASNGARFGLYHSLLALIKILAPVLPYITEAIFQALYFSGPGEKSIHGSEWPRGDPAWRDTDSEDLGQRLVEITSLVRRYKSEQSLSLATELEGLVLACGDDPLRSVLMSSYSDLMSSTRAKRIEVLEQLPKGLEILSQEADLQVAILPPASSPSDG